MRTIPRKQIKDNEDILREIQIQTMTRKIAIAFVLLIQLAIIFKMLT